MNPLGFLAVGLGAAFGAWLRWGLSVRLNAAWPALPAGTLAANLIGGYLVGLLVAWFQAHPSLPPEWRLFAITGFLGGLTTFSTFSAEAVALVSSGRLALALAHSGLHLCGSLCLTALGITTFRLLARP
jgi:CrcB protein